MKPQPATNNCRDSKARRRLFLPLPLLCSVMLLLACGGDDDDDDGGGDGGNPPRTFTCQASTMPATLDYVVDGDVLEVTAGGQTDSLDRVAAGDPGRPVYGTWHIDTITEPGVGTVSVDIQIEPDRVNALADCDFGSVSANAVATSAATITDTTITILEADEDIEIVTE